MTYADLPGADVVDQGLHDLEQGVETVESLLVSIASPRLRALGLRIPESFPDAELRLYQLLAERQGAAAHATFNALIRRGSSASSAPWRARVSNARSH
jgi:hypothetical protein